MIDINESVFTCEDGTKLYPYDSVGYCLGNMITVGRIVYSTEEQAFCCLSADVSITARLDEVNSLHALTGLERCVHANKLRNMSTIVDANRAYVESLNNAEV